MIKERVHSWNKEKYWTKLMRLTAQAANLNAEEAAALNACIVAEIIAATAYISDCRDKERVIISHLSTLIAGHRCREVYNHQPGETLAERLITGSFYPGGDPDAVKAGMLLLELISLKDHGKDLITDMLTCKYNPLIMEMNGQDEEKRIFEEYRSLPVDIQNQFKLLLDKAIVAGPYWYW